MKKLLILIGSVVVLCGCQVLQHETLVAANAAELGTSPDSAEPRLVVVRSDEPLRSFTLEQQPYANEDRDYGTPLLTSLIPVSYEQPTPVFMPGAESVSTYQLHRLLTGKQRKPILINTLQGAFSEVIAGSVWLSGAGDFGRMDDAVQQRLGTILETLTAGDKRRKLLFYCLGYDCWAAYNAGLRAIAMGYRKVQWYRGGLRSWSAAGLPTRRTEDDRW